MSFLTKEATAEELEGVHGFCFAWKPGIVCAGISVCVCLCV